MTTNAQIAEAFIAAKKHLAHDYCDSSKKVHICNALWAAYYNAGYCNGKEIISNYAMHDAKSIIRKRLGKFSYLDEWLLKHHPEVKKEYLDSITGEKMQATRHAWIDSLIKEFSK